MSAESENISFALIFTDLTILLTTFFIFLNAVAVPDEDRERSAIESVGELFPAKRSPPEERSEMTVSGIAPVAVERLQQMSRTKDFSALVSMATDGGVRFKAEDSRFTMTIPSDRLFAGGDEIRADFLPFMRSLAEEARLSGWRLEIVSHTGIDEPRDSLGFEDNWDLSAAQAEALLRFFTDERIDPQAISAQGKAHFLPEFSNETADGKAKNARVVLTLAADSGARNG